MPANSPTAADRWRCALCGNLTRFDRTVTRRTVEFVHVDLSGTATVEDAEVVTEEVVEVRCRWCGSTDIELVARPGADGDSSGDGDADGNVGNVGGPS